MFFWLKDQIDLNDSAQFDALENLGEAGFAGRHLVLGDRGLIDVIASAGGLSRKASAYFRSVRSKYAQVAGIRRSVKKINVSADCQSPMLDGEWTVPLQSFRTDDAVERVLLLVEHMYDYKVIVGLAHIFLKELGVASWVNLSLTPVSGGGGGTSITLSVHQSNMRSLGMCIVDSDRPHIKGALGSTARGCVGVYEERWGWNLHILNARELENVIPPQIYERGGVEYSVENPDGYKIEAWPVYGFVDMKKGDCLCRFRSLVPGDLSYKETQVALAHYKADSGKDCPSQFCKLCAAGEGALIALAASLERYPLVAERMLPSRVPPLTALLNEVIGYAAAAKWSMT